MAARADAQVKELTSNRWSGGAGMGFVGSTPDGVAEFAFNGIDYAVTERLAITADFLLNFTSLGETVRAGGREFDLHTNVMPALYLGIRF
jgi:hypothetical protein